MQFADNTPDIVLITKVIPTAQPKLIYESKIGFNVFLNCDPTLHNLGPSYCHGIGIYVSNTVSATDLAIP